LHRELWWGKHDGKRQFGPLNINGNIILKTILKEIGDVLN
jgi:hypothetical protein